MADQGRRQRSMLDFPGFAQEFLRRNPSYRAEYRDLMTAGRNRKPVKEEEMARRWGLSFSLCTAPSGG